KYAPPSGKLEDYYIVSTLVHVTVDPMADKEGILYPMQSLYITDRQGFVKTKENAIPSSIEYKNVQEIDAWVSAYMTKESASRGILMQIAGREVPLAVKRQ
ncbi:hypothetical protein, partial [Paenibacillus ferrarius]|uniref:hypothetical protein n=1 Tax=Paenibacillus ferrarius TaxID=1469647 RepID=UPI003D2D644C